MDEYDHDGFVAWAIEEGIECEVDFSDEPAPQSGN